MSKNNKEKDTENQTTEGEENKGSNETDPSELESKLSKLEQDFESVVSELKEQRKKKQEAEAERDIYRAKLENSQDGTEDGDDKSTQDVEEIVKRTLQERDRERIEEIRKSAERKFKQSHKEFHEDNDPAGLKYQALQEQLNRMDTSGIRSENDFQEVYEDALAILNRRQGRKSRDSSASNTPYAETPKGTSGVGPKEGEGDISSKEKKVINEQGWTKERYLDLKKRRPSYVKALLKHVE